ncbi:hypothetical protein Q2T46_15765 [Thermoanaerobacterium sp. CMT5567-10]|jgi:hypothetical protein|uniref:hypothetical protein n=1 Tax=Thermoanaerobacterium sp. CMT5567-10 TaxID=3061989 RepID=UPI00287F4B1F|nr:hypothetical protein [Thermoanaerobacterium sp. CMT5567-10]WLY85413.1 hypothetical protein Q2T46_15765 [Thermoanaerobacterium sp. CMT5567-10]
MVAINDYFQRADINLSFIYAGRKIKKIIKNIKNLLRNVKFWLHKKEFKNFYRNMIIEKYKNKFGTF